MTFSLYAATIPSNLQILKSVDELLDKATAYCGEHALPPEEIVQARLAADMLPFTYQVKSTVTHSLGAIEGIRAGVFAPDLTPPPQSFEALKAMITETLAALEKIEPAEIDAFVGRDMRFSFRERNIDFTAEEFLLSFSQPNFYFHASTAYDILRWKGLPIGKRDFTGRLRIKKR